MFARVAARVSRACAMNDSLVASGAVDTKLMWQIPRLALALQCSIPPLDAPRFKNFDYAEFVEGAAHAYAVLNEVVYTGSKRTKTPNCSRRRARRRSRACSRTRRTSSTPATRR